MLRGFARAERAHAHGAVEQRADNALADDAALHERRATAVRVLLASSLEVPDRLGSHEMHGAAVARRACLRHGAIESVRQWMAVHGRRGWDRTTDLWLMRPTSYRCSTLRSAPVSSGPHAVRAGHAQCSNSTHCACRVESMRRYLPQPWRVADGNRTRCVWLHKPPPYRRASVTMCRVSCGRRSSHARKEHASIAGVAASTVAAFGHRPLVRGAQRCDLRRASRWILRRSARLAPKGS